MSYKKRGLGRGFSNFLSDEMKREINSEIERSTEDFVSSSDSENEKSDLVSDSDSEFEIELDGDSLDSFSDISNVSEVTIDKENPNISYRTFVRDGKLYREHTEVLYSGDDFSSEDNSSREISSDINSSKNHPMSGLSNISVSRIIPNEDQPRKYFDPEILEDLRDSIEQFGIISPLVVRPSKHGYSLIAGERRLRAAIMAGLSEVPCIIVDATDLEADKMSIIENIQREDLNPIEEALAYKKLIEGYNMLQEELGKSLGKSRQYIGNRMRLLRLPSVVQDMIAGGEISYSHGLILLSLPSEEDMIKEAKRIAKKSLSVRSSSKKKRENPPRDKYLDAILENMSSHLGTKIDVRGTGRVKKLEIEYYSDEDFERICGIIMGGELF